MLINEAQKKGLSELNINLFDLGYSFSVDRIKNGIELLFDGKNITVKYAKDNEFYRAVAVLLAQDFSKPFHIKQKNFFDTLSVMADNSRNAVMKVSTVKLWLRKMALMGYNQFQLYTEDTFEVDNQPYFGYKRGKFTQEEIREIVDYADLFGIEVIPAIQTLAHFTALKRWQVYYEHIDYNDILLVDDERTYKLIEDMLISIKKCYKSKRINIGMDEAHMLGLGKFLDKHGYEQRYSILIRHLKKVLQLLDKHGFEPMMWSDMFFRSAITQDYYIEKAVKYPQELKEQIPDGVKLIYWDYYGTNKNKYNAMLETHMQLEKEIWFAGGVWTWMGFAPMNKYSIECAKVALEACKKFDVKNVIMTLWNDDTAECQLINGLSGLSYAAEIAYDNEKNIGAIFKAITNVEFSDWNKLDYPNEICLPFKTYNSNCCKYYFFNDYFLGMLDNCVHQESGALYKKYTRRLRLCSKKYPEWSILFTTMADLCSVLELKSDLGIKTRELYSHGDKQGLTALLKKKYTPLLKRLEKFYNSIRQQWYYFNKENGFEIQDVRIGGVIQRTKDCMLLINEYINGQIERITELEEPVLNWQGVDSKDVHIMSGNKIFSPSDISFMG